MNSFDALVEGNEVLCNVVEPDVPFHGTLSLKGNSIRLEVMACYRAVQNRGKGSATWEGRVVLETQHGSTITLLNALQFRSYTYPTEYKRFLADAAIIGNRAFPAENRVGRISARVPQVREAFTDTEREAEFRRKVESGEKLDDDDRISLGFAHENAVVQIERFARTSSMPQQRIEFLDPVISVAFHNPVDLGEATGELGKVITFLAISVGVPINIGEYRIRREGIGEAKELVSADDLPEIYGVIRIPSVVPAETTQAKGFPSKQDLIDQAIFTGINRDEIEVCGLAMQMWFERKEEWKNAYIAIGQMLKFGNHCSVERLINSFSWFERIPGYRADKRDLSRAIVREFIQRVMTVATDLGIDGRKDRIEGCLGKISSESQDSWIRRLLHMVGDRLPNGLNVERFRQTIVEGFELRAEAAHGKFVELENRNLESVVRSIFAFETLCLLLTIRDFPLTDRGARALEARTREKTMFWCGGEGE